MTKILAKNPDGRFLADPDGCIACGKCVADCPSAIIEIEDGVARVKPEDQEDCLLCQHCLAICPTAAVTVSGRDPGDSVPIDHGDPDMLDVMVRSRRSLRHFAPGAVDRKVLDRVLAGMAHAPTGVNSRHRRVAVIHDRGAMDDFRDASCRLILEHADRLPEDEAWLAGAASRWLEKGRDVIFRTAPHLVVVTLGPGAVTRVPDAVIALSYFELLAQANGIATVWCGMVDMMLRAIPESRKLLGIPDDHTIGYAMLFGKPAFRYERTVQYEQENLAWIDRIPKG